MHFVMQTTTIQTIIIKSTNFIQSTFHRRFSAPYVNVCLSFSNALPSLFHYASLSLCPSRFIHLCLFSDFQFARVYKLSREPFFSLSQSQFKIVQICRISYVKKKHIRLHTVQRPSPWFFCLSIYFILKQSPTTGK